MSGRREPRRSSEECLIAKAVDIYLAHESAVSLKSYLDRGRKLKPGYCGDRLQSLRGRRPQGNAVGERWRQRGNDRIFLSR